MIQTLYQPIESLVMDIRKGKLLLPEVQRGYVWKSTQVRDLFDSLYHVYPSGQLLVWETDDLPLSHQMSVEGLSKEERHPQLLLDGQQRLTSLAAVMLGRPLIVRDTTKPIDIVFNVFTEKFEVAGRRHTIQNGWISLVKFFTEGAMPTFIDLGLDSKTQEAKIALENLNRLDNIKKYPYHVNLLLLLSYAEVTRIFVRTNSGGTKLGYGDLALAQVSSSWQGVTEELEQYQKHIKKQGLGLELDNGLLLRAIAVILTKQSRFIRFLKTDHKELTIYELKAGWERAKMALDNSISFLANNCMIDRLDMLPTRSVLMPLVAFFDRSNLTVNNTQLRALQRWVYMALIWSRYSGSSETAMDQDIAALDKEDPIQAMIQNIEDVVGHKRPVTENELRDQRKNSPYMLMSYILARRANAQDWFNGMVISNDHASELVLHHIFPKTFLGKQYRLREESRIVDQVANLVFLTTPLSKADINRSPVEYLPKIEEQRLKAQYIPLEPKLWAVDQFEECMLQRRTLLADAINQLLVSLTEDKRIWVSSTKDILEMRIDVLERQLRILIERRLDEARGDGAWDMLVPAEIRNSVGRLVKKEVENKPFEAGQHETLEAKLKFCLYSELLKIIKENWVLFQDVFGKETKLEQYSYFVLNARNKIKHGNALSELELASAEAGLLWLEECLRMVKLEEETEDELIGQAL